LSESLRASAVVMGAGGSEESSITRALRSVQAGILDPLRLIICEVAKLHKLRILL
jgi:hypothetical protein